MEPKRRAKGMGSITYLGKGRRKPFLAIISKKSIGTYQSEEECEKAILGTVMTQQGLLPEFAINDPLKNEYISFIVELQAKRMLPKSVFEFPEMSVVVDMFKNKMQLNTQPLSIVSNSNPPFSDEALTFAEIWEFFFTRVNLKKSPQWRNSMKAAFKKFNSIHGIKIPLIKVSMIQECFDNIMNSEKGIGKSSLNNMNIVLAATYRESEKLKQTKKGDNPCEYIEYQSTGKPRYKRKPFTEEEVKIILDDKSEEAMIVSMYIFTGMRPSELIKIPRCDIHVDEKYMIGGIKTANGKDRIVPLHNYIIPYINYFLENYSYPYLFFNEHNKSSYGNYNKIFNSLMVSLNLADHEEPYDTRYTFATLAKTSGVSESARKKIMGHGCSDLTDDVYTHEPLNYFLSEINKIKIC